MTDVEKRRFAVGAALMLAAIGAQGLWPSAVPWGSAFCFGFAASAFLLGKT